MQDRDPRGEGLRARLSGLSDADNPYDPVTEAEAYRAWDAGWDTEDMAHDGDD